MSRTESTFIYQRISHVFYVHHHALGFDSDLTDYDSTDHLFADCDNHVSSLNLICNLWSSLFFYDHRSLCHDRAYLTCDDRLYDSHVCEN